MSARVFRSGPSASSLGAVKAAAFLAAVLVAACGRDGPPPESTGTATAASPEPEGAALLAGTSLRDWALLAIPRAGGTPTARSLRDPGEVVWEGSVSLPAASEIHRLDGPLVVLRTEEGEVLRYDPREDTLTAVGEVGSGAAWSSWGSYGLFFDPGGSALLQIGPEGSWEYEIAAEALWASPVEEGRVAVLVEEERPTMWLVGRGSSEPETRNRIDLAPPGLVTAWGKRIAVGAEANPRLRFLTVPELSVAGQVSLDAPPVVIAASPSSHEVYASLGDPPRLARINRFTSAVTRVSEFARELRVLRPAHLGQFLLGFDGASPLWIPLSDEEPVPLEGEWRDDLPLGLPTGRVLEIFEGALRVWDPEEAESYYVDGPVDHWWTAMNWNPAPPPVVAGPVSPEERPGEPGEEPEGDPSIGGEEIAGRDSPAGEGEAASGVEGEPRGPAPGLYAIAGSARDRDGVEDLTARLSEAGFPTSVQRHEDDAGQVWHRALVGPFAVRDEAEAAARQLRREQSLQVWITEVRSAPRPDEAPEDG